MAILTTFPDVIDRSWWRAPPPATTFPHSPLEFENTSQSSITTRKRKMRFSFGWMFASALAAVLAQPPALPMEQWDTITKYPEVKDSLGNRMWDAKKAWLGDEQPVPAKNRHRLTLTVIDAKGLVHLHNPSNLHTKFTVKRTDNVGGWIWEAELAPKKTTTFVGMEGIVNIIE
ncbi:hypothetical protein Pst134EA_025858 [Puccinia striiformis f. sp. tritici]|uniref:hypothetical protein n=1 Tax=Puccinia striiformis f. sp. tritici TaxID=168172 RepID=UPI0020089187|nr:hypothetical protein Pst134EA_025858 [Puccinia striiformis f. sp. tritici]KAH9451921.1 hypothetical protein Pst134EA_025858 [Puccinia striiformis f. sp. tritici]